MTEGNPVFFPRKNVKTEYLVNQVVILFSNLVYHSLPNSKHPKLRISLLTSKFCYYVTFKKKVRFRQIFLASSKQMKFNDGRKSGVYSKKRMLELVNQLIFSQIQFATDCQIAPEIAHSLLTKQILCFCQGDYQFPLSICRPDSTSTRRRVHTTYQCISG